MHNSFSRGRRLTLSLAALPVVYMPLELAPKLSTDDRRFLGGVVRELGMGERLDFRALAVSMRRIVDKNALKPIIGEATQRMRIVIGDAFHTAGASVPSLIHDDFDLGRTLTIVGVVFSYTELALLLSLVDQTSTFSAES